MASTHLMSRFDVLKVQDTVNTDRKQPQNNQKKTTKNKNEQVASENAKKRARKKKRQLQLQSERDDLRGMMFMQKGASGGQGQNQTGPAHAQSNSKSSDKKVPQSHTKVSHTGDRLPESWKDRDEELLDQQFEADLQKALLESKVLHEETKAIKGHEGHPRAKNETVLTWYLKVLDAIKDLPEEKVNQKEETSKKDKKSQKKEKQHAMSLQQFLSNTTPKTGVGLDEIPTPKEPEVPVVIPKEDTFFKDIEKEATGIVKKDNHRRKANSLTKAEEEDEGEIIRSLQFKEELKNRDDEIKQLREELRKQKDELSQVKKRNKQLCVILAQGEMKDKAEVLRQLEELTTVKDELTQEVQELHTALEQERSKVSSLKSELQKVQEKRK